MIVKTIQLKTLKKLELLSYVKNLFSNIDFSNTYLFGVQHLYLSTYELFKTLVLLGFNPDNIALIGKCYSTDPKALTALKELEIDVCESSLQFNSHISYDKQIYKNVEKFFKKKLKEKKIHQFKKIILLDDGGTLLSKIIPDLNYYSQNMIGIEQTSSGYHLLKKSEMKFPVINVARSHIKLIYETPIVTQIIAKAMLEALLKLKINHKLTNILIIGRGFIGKGIYKFICNQFSNITFYDTSVNKTQIKKKEFKDKLKEFDVIIGCTGTTVFTADDYNFLKKDAILISASSSDIEFDSVYLRKGVKTTTVCHRDIYAKNLYLINSGFPINFSSDFEKSDPNEFELTRSTLLAAIIQANNYQNYLPPKFISLKASYQQEIINKYLSIYKNI